MIQKIVSNVNINCIYYNDDIIYYFTKNPKFKNEYLFTYLFPLNT